MFIIPSSQVSWAALITAEAYLLQLHKYDAHKAAAEEEGEILIFEIRVSRHLRHSNVVMCRQARGGGCGAADGSGRAGAGDEGGGERHAGRPHEGEWRFRVSRIVQVGSRNRCSLV